ncbi:hypothetical protein [Campylobacter curvus]|uniref:hypothetical protein n=1 Tax=Campylobacter curvus TaxID=200 RepID=UPI00146FE287|nr:hypothetical protein [Campylobacter curvus]
MGASGDYVASAYSPKIFYPSSSFADDLGGHFGSYPFKTQVQVSGSSDIYMVFCGFPLLVAENTFTFVYALSKYPTFSDWFFCPEAYLSAVAEPKNDIDESSIHQFSFENFGGLKGDFGSFVDNAYVKVKGFDNIFQIKKSFFILNSANASIICYKLKGVDKEYSFYTPHSMLVGLSDVEFVAEIVRAQNSGSSEPPHAIG